MAKSAERSRKRNESSGVNKYLISIAVIVVLLLSIPLTAYFAQQYKSKEALAASTAAVSIVDFEFSPASITVPVGTTVTWTNMSVSKSDHTTTSDVAGTANSWDSGLTNPVSTSGLPDTFSFTFTNTGTFTYHCNVHTFMHGTVIVTAAAAAPTATTAPTAAAAPSPTAVSAVPSPNCLGSGSCVPTTAPTNSTTGPTIAPVITLSPSDGSGGSLNPISLILFLIELILKFLQSLVH